MAPPREPEPDFRYEGFTSPNVTPVPDDLFDVLAPRLAEVELRLLLYMVRRIFGFKKDGDAISFSQMMHGIRKRDGTILDHGTGMSKSAVWRAVNSLSAKGVIEAEKRQTVDGDSDTTVYRLRFRNGGGVVLQKNHGGSPREQGVVLQENPQHDRSQHDSKQQQPAPSPTTDAQASPSLNVVVASSKIRKDTTRNEGHPALLADLTALGVSASVARQLVTKYSEEAIQEQIAALAFRTNVKDPGAVLVQSIKESWAMPRTYVDAKVNAERASQSQDERDAADAARKAAEQARRDRQVKIDAYLAVLPENETEELTVAATRQLRDSTGSFWTNRAIPNVLLNATIRNIVAGRMGLGPESPHELS